MQAGLLDEAKAYALTGGGSGVILKGGRVVLAWGSQTQLYDIKSTTKSIGVTAAGLAIADGLISLDDLAQQHLPGIGLPPDSNSSTGWLEQITLRQLSTHTAGFAKQGGYIALTHAPGTMWSYSDGGLNWLADVLTQVFTAKTSTRSFSVGSSPCSGSAVRISSGDRMRRATTC